MSEDPEIEEDARRLLMMVKHSWDERACEEKVRELIYKWKDRAYREGFENGKESCTCKKAKL